MRHYLIVTAPLDIWSYLTTPLLHNLTLHYSGALGIDPLPLLTESLGGGVPRPFGNMYGRGRGIIPNVLQYTRGILMDNQLGNLLPLEDSTPIYFCVSFFMM